MKLRNFIILLTLLPLGAIAQESPIKWSCRAVRIDQNHFQFFIDAYLLRGWNIYEANMRKKCILSPIITFDKKEGMKPVGGVEVIEGIEADTIYRWCRAPRYKSSVTYVQEFQMPITKGQVVTGKVVYQAVNQDFVDSERTYSFSLNVGAEITLEEINRRQDAGFYTTGFVCMRNRNLPQRVWKWIKNPHF